MKPKVLFSILVCFFLAACRNQGADPVFQFKGISIGQESFLANPTFALELSCNLDYLKLFEKEKAANIYLSCPIPKGDSSESNPGKEGFLLRSMAFISEVRSSHQGDEHIYSFPVGFFDSERQKWLNENEIYNLISGRNCIRCKMIMPFMTRFPKSAIESPDFCIPADSISELIDE